MSSLTSVVAANSVMNDAHYQTALHFLTVGLEAGKVLAKDMGNLMPFYLDTLKFSSKLLSDMVQERASIVKNFGSAKESTIIPSILVRAGIVPETKMDLPLSYPLADLFKNAALSGIKYMQVLKIAHNVVSDISKKKRNEGGEGSITAAPFNAKLLDDHGLETAQGEKKESSLI